MYEQRTADTSLLFYSLLDMDMDILDIEIMQQNDRIKNIQYTTIIHARRQENVKEKEDESEKFKFS